MPDEHGEPAQHDTFQFGEKLIAPIERRLQRFLPRRRAAVSQQEQSETLVKKGFGFPQTVGVDAPGGQLDRQRHAVKFAADTHNDRHFSFAYLQVSATRRRPFNKETRRWKCLRGRAHDLRFLRRTGERIQSIDLLSLDLKNFSTCRQNVNLRRLGVNLRRQCRNGIDEMLASVENEQHSLAAEISDQGRCRVIRPNRQSHQRSDRRGHQTRIAQHAQVDDHDGVLERLDQVVPDSNSHGGFADATNPDDADEAGSHEMS